MKRLIVILAVVLMVVGCAVGQHRYYGAFNSVDGLQQAKVVNGLAVYHETNTAQSRFSKVKIMPLAVFFEPGTTMRYIHQPDIELLNEYYQAEVKKSLGPYFEFVKDDEPADYELHGAIFDVEVGKQIMNVLGRDNLSYALDFSASKFFISLSEVQTLKKVLAVQDNGFIYRDNGIEDAPFRKWEKVHNMIDTWLASTDDILEQVLLGYNAD